METWSTSWRLYWDPYKVKEAFHYENDLQKFVRPCAGRWVRIYRMGGPQRAARIIFASTLCSCDCSQSVMSFRPKLLWFSQQRSIKYGDRAGLSPLSVSIAAWQCPPPPKWTPEFRTNECHATGSTYTSCNLLRLTAMGVFTFLIH